MNSEVKRKILWLLNDDARITVEEIGDRLAMEASVVAEMIDQMESEGIIKGYHALIDDEFLRHGGVRAIIEVSVQPERDGGFDRVARLVSKFDEVRSVYPMSGGYDLQIEVLGTSLQHVALFVASKLAPMEGVRSTATHFLLKKYKEAGFVLEKDEEYERLKVSP